MGTQTTTADLMDSLRLLEKEDQMDLLEYIKKRYSKSFRITENYRKNALSQIRSALNSQL